MWNPQFGETKRYIKWKWIVIRNQHNVSNLVTLVLMAQQDIDVEILLRPFVRLFTFLSSSSYQSQDVNCWTYAFPINLQLPRLEASFSKKLSYLMYLYTHIQHSSGCSRRILYNSIAPPTKKLNIYLFICLSIFVTLSDPTLRIFCLCQQLHKRWIFIYNYKRAQNSQGASPNII